MDDRGRAWLYLGLALLAIVVFFVGHWALATYYPLDYDTDAIVLPFILAIMILGLYGAFRLYQLRHPQ
jgi:ABC-type antimicrobial peptide transport system permease subunit